MTNLENNPGTSNRATPLFHRFQRPASVMMKNIKFLHPCRWRTRTAPSKSARASRVPLMSKMFKTEMANGSCRWWMDSNPSAQIVLESTPKNGAAETDHGLSHVSGRKLQLTWGVKLLKPSYSDRAG